MGRAPDPDPEPEDAAPEAVEGAAPGVAALFDGAHEDGTHSVLDLGRASAASLRLYSRFARRMRFADLVGAATAPQGWKAALEALPPQPEHPYDLLLGWDILDRLGPEARAPLVERLVEVSAPGARLHVLVNASQESVAHPFRFTLLAVDRMRYETTGPPRPRHPPILPTQVERLLEPFQVVRGFTLKGGLREYVAVHEES